jgi:hypothetical protein
LWVRFAGERSARRLRGTGVTPDRATDRLKPQSTEAGTATSSVDRRTEPNIWVATPRGGSPVRPAHTPGRIVSTPRARRTDPPSACRFASDRRAGTPSAPVRGSTPNDPAARMPTPRRVLPNRAGRALDSRAMTRLARHLVLLLLACSTIGCTVFTGNSRVLVTSEPAGAEILVDGKPTGRTTPSLVKLGGIFGGDREITVRKTGYEPETRPVTQWTTTESSRWIDAASSDLSLIAFPVFWTLREVFLPFTVRWQYVPQELYVRLYPIGEAPKRAFLASDDE